MHPLDRKKYRILNLSNGDKVIGEILEKSGSSITIYRPYALKILTMMDSLDDDPESIIRQEMLVLKNWLDMSKTDKAEIERNHILSMTEPTDKVCDFYDAEKAKDDNPDMMNRIIKKLQEEKDKLPDEDEEDEWITPEGPPEGQYGINSIIDDIIYKNLKSLDPDEDDDENEELDPESGSEYNHDTDKDMYGW
jgi:hypothetical protein